MHIYAWKKQYKVREHTASQTDRQVVLRLNQVQIYYINKIWGLE